MTNKQDLYIEISAKVDKANKEIERLKKSFKELSSTIKKSSTDAEKVEKSYKNLSKSAEELKKSLIGIVTAYASFAGASKAVEITSRLEQGFIEIAKTTGLAGQELEQLKDKVLSLSTELKGVSLEELQKIVAIAGQLGVQGKDNIAEFTEVVAKMAIATDLTAEKSAVAFARLQNILGLTAKDLEKLGSTINHLSNNTTALASDIVEIANRMGGVAKSFGLTTAEVLGFASALKDIGVSSEVAGSSFTNLLLQMQTEGEQFAKFMGITFEQFSKLLSDKPTEAIIKFIEKFKELNAAAKTNALKDLGINDVNMVQTIFKLAEGLDKVKKNLQLASEEYRRGTSLQKEYETASQGLANRWKALENAIKGLIFKFGEELLPIMKQVTDELVDFTKNLNGEQVRNFAKDLSAIAKAVTELIGLFGKLNDLLFPDKVGFAESNTLIGAVFEGWGKILKVISTDIELFGDAVRDVFGGVSEDARDMGVTYENVAQAMIDATERLDAKFRESNKTLEERQKIIKQNEAIQQQLAKQLLQASNEGNLQAVDAFKSAMQRVGQIIEKEKAELKKDIEVKKENVRVTRELANQTLIYSKKMLDALKRTNERRLREKTRVVEALKRKEQKLVEDIERLHKEMIEKLAKLDSERVYRIEELDTKIRNLRTAGLSDYEQYTDKLKQIEENLAKAKEALRQGDLDKFKHYAQIYEQLVDSIANTEIKGENKVLVTKQQTRQVAIQYLEQLKNLEMNYYNQKQALIRQEYEATIQAKKAELIAVREQIVANMQLIEVIKQLSEALTGKKLDINTREAQEQIKRLDAQIKKLDAELAKSANKKYKTKIEVDTKEVKQAKQEIKSLGKLTLNGVTLEVTAETTPADFGIRSLITEHDGDVIIMKMNPEYLEAEQKINEFIQQASSKEAVIKTDADTTEAEQDIDEVEEETEGRLLLMMVDADTGEVIKKVEKVYKDVNGKRVEIDVNADTEQAETKIKKVSKKRKTEIKADAKTKEAEAKIKKLTKPEVKIIKIKVNDTYAKEAIKKLTEPTSSIHTIYVRKVEQHALGGFVGRLAGGGRIAGYDPTDSDDVLALLTRGEYVITRRAVKYYGEEFLNAINAMLLPKFATGGLVPIGSKNFIQTKTTELKNKQITLDDVKDIKQKEVINFDDLERLLEKVQDLIDTLEELADTLKAGGAEKLMDVLKALNSLKNAENMLNRDYENLSLADVQRMKLTAFQALEEGKNVKEKVDSYLNRVDKTKEAIYDNFKRLGVDDEQLKNRVENSLNLSKLQNFETALEKIKLPSKEELASSIQAAMRDAFREYGLFSSVLANSFFDARIYRSMNSSIVRKILERIFGRVGRFMIDFDTNSIFQEVLYREIETNGFKLDASKVAEEIIKKILQVKLPKFKHGGLVDFTRGGRLRGYGGGDRNLALLENGEYVIRKEAVKKYGLETLDRLNAKSLNLNNKKEYANIVQVDLRLPNGKSYTMEAKQNIVEELVRELRRL